MERGFVFAGIFVGFCVGVISLAIYTFVLFQLGKTLGRRRTAAYRPLPVIGSILGVSVAISMLGLLAPVTLLYKGVLVLSVALLHAHPTCMGLWAGVEEARAADKELFESRANAWLSEWEQVSSELEP